MLVLISLYILSHILWETKCKGIKYYRRRGRGFTMLSLKCWGWPQGIVYAWKVSPTDTHPPALKRLAQQFTGGCYRDGLKMNWWVTYRHQPALKRTACVCIKLLYHHLGYPRVRAATLSNQTSFLWLTFTLLSTGNSGFPSETLQILNSQKFVAACKVTIQELCKMRKQARIRMDFLDHQQRWKIPTSMIWHQGGLVTGSTWPKWFTGKEAIGKEDWAGEEMGLL